MQHLKVKYLLKLYVRLFTRTERKYDQQCCNSIATIQALTLLVSLYSRTHKFSLIHTVFMAAKFQSEKKALFFFNFLTPVIQSTLKIIMTLHILTMALDLLNRYFE